MFKREIRDLATKAKEIYTEACLAEAKRIIESCHGTIWEKTERLVTRGYTLRDAAILVMAWEYYVI